MKCRPSSGYCFVYVRQGRNLDTIGDERLIVG